MPDAAQAKIVVSVVIPVWNEDPRALQILHKRLVQALERLNVPWEALFVDDRSEAATVHTLQALADCDSRVRCLQLVRRCGQETAVVAGLMEAKGELICTMDGDLENCPEEIPRILAPLRQGYDLVLGRRRQRPGLAWRRRVSSKLFNKAMNIRWWTRISDWGCGLNAVRRTVLEGLRDRLGRWTQGPLKAGFIRQAARWIEVDVIQDVRYCGGSRYSWGDLCGLGIRAFTTGHRVILMRDGPELVDNGQKSEVGKHQDAAKN